MRLASEVDEVLHEGRRIDFSDYREGDLAILKNQLSKMVATLRDATMRLEKEKGALADALADVSHQIRTPLTAMSLMVPAIEKSTDDAERTRTLRELERMIDRVGWLVSTLLKVAKVDAGAFRVQKAPRGRRPHGARRAFAACRRTGPARHRLHHRRLGRRVVHRRCRVVGRGAGERAEELHGAHARRRRHPRGSARGRARLRIHVTDTGPGIAPGRPAARLRALLSGAGRRNVSREQGAARDAGQGAEPQEQGTGARAPARRRRDAPPPGRRRASVSGWRWRSRSFRPKGARCGPRTRPKAVRAST